MLSKEECEKALENLMKFGGNGILFMLLMVIDDVACFKNLIDEHFDPQPYKFEDLKEGMWVWDDAFKEICFIPLIVNRNKIYTEYLESHCLNDPCMIQSFEENRFFPLTKAMYQRKEDKE